MNLKQLAYAMRAAGDLARAGERLFDSLSSRRMIGLPFVVGIGVGVGVAALVFSDEARKQVKAWIREANATVRVSARPVEEAKVQVAARPS